MCYLVRCEICGALMEFEDYYAHATSCKPELEKVEVSSVSKGEKKKKAN